MLKTAFLVDGAFFIRRYHQLFPDSHTKSGDDIARSLQAAILQHLRHEKRPQRALYRTFFYDCPPLQKRVQNPVSRCGHTLGNTPEAIQRSQLHKALIKQRKFALRLGRIADETSWILKPDPLRRLLRGDINVGDLTEQDVTLNLRQKGVDMRIGLDIASLAYKKQVDQLVLIAGDSDFVPAAKHARREGMDFLLDPMWNRINEDLREHIDGLYSPWPKPPRDSD